MIKRHFVKGAGAVLGSLLCMGLWCGGAQAAAGDLDMSFGVGGRAFSDFQKFIAVGRSGALQSDKKIVSAGSGARFFNSDQFTGFDFIVTRNKADGTLDTDFGYDGVAFADFGSNDLLSKVVVQSDGKILVGGYTDFVSGDNSRSVFALARFNGNGKLDTSFGIGGKVVSVFSDRSVCMTSMALQSDGKIVAVGCLDSASQSGNFLVVRFNANGTLDTSFGTNGVVTEDLDAFNDSFNSVVVQSDGKILAGGTSSDPNNSSSGRFALARYNANGTPDTSFDGDGKAFTDFDGGASAINSLALQSDGKIVAGGNASGFVSDFALARYNTDGTLDTGFGTNGRITTDFAGDADSINSIVVQSDGKILAGGEAQSEDGIAGVLARYNINGTPDTSFGNAGQGYWVLQC